MKIKKRFFKIMLLFFKIFLDFRKEFNLVKKKGYKTAQKKMFKTHEKRAKELYNLAISLGGVLIKLCQYFSTRRDIFPAPYIEALKSLQDQVPPVPFNEIEKILKNEYVDYHKVFLGIEATALASASLGQTHKAKLISGEEVVIKVLKPDIDKIIDIDFSILYHVFRFFSNFKVFKERADFFSLLYEFINTTGDELNFKREIFVSKILKKKLSHLEYLKIPYVFEGHSTKKVIVMEYCDGDKITEIEKWGKRNNDPITISKRIIEIYMEQFINVKIIHYDPHPGNISVTDNNNLVLLDFGMSGEISNEMSNGVKEGIRAFINKDYQTIIKVLDKLGFLRKGTNKYKLESVMEYFFDEIINTVTLEKESIMSVNLNPILDDLIELIYTQPISLPVEWAFIGRTIGTLIGIISFLNPKIKIYDELEPYAQKLLADNLSEIIDRTKYSIKNFTLNTLQLPKRMNDTIEKIEKGEISFKVDFDEIDEKLDEMKSLVIRLVAFGLSLVNFVGFYLLYFLNKKNTSFTLLFLGMIFLLASVFRRKRNKKDIIKKQLSNNN